jgi:alkylhydroperoxidase family enzyme
MSTNGFLDVPESTLEARRLYDDDVAEVGYVMNASRLWAYQPGTVEGLFDLMREATSAHGPDIRQRGILVAACAATLGDSYCALSWGSKLAEAADSQTASAVLRGDDDGLTTGERAMAAWARKVVRDPNGTSGADVQVLRDAGYGDAAIFAITVFVALRIAFSTVNDALGVRPDAAFRSTAPEAVLNAVTFGRPIDDETSKPVPQPTGAEG